MDSQRLQDTSQACLLSFSTVLWMLTEGRFRNLERRLDPVGRFWASRSFTYFATGFDIRDGAAFGVVLKGVATAALATLLSRYERHDQDFHGVASNNCCRYQNKKKTCRCWQWASRKVREPDLSKTSFMWGRQPEIGWPSRILGTETDNLKKVISSKTLFVILRTNMKIVLLRISDDNRRMLIFKWNLVTARINSSYSLSYLT